METTPNSYICKIQKDNAWVCADVRIPLIFQCEEKGGVGAHLKITVPFKFVLFFFLSFICFVLFVLFVWVFFYSISSANRVVNVVCRECLYLVRMCGCSYMQAGVITHACMPHFVPFSVVCPCLNLTAIAVP